MLFFDVRSIYPKSHAMTLGFWFKKGFESDLGNEVMYFVVDQEAAKILEIKIGE